MLSIEEAQTKRRVQQNQTISGTGPNHRQSLKVAYIMSRFPKLTETFILYEMLAVEQEGVQVQVYPLLREKTDTVHPEAESFAQTAHFQPFISPSIIRANLHFLLRKPGVYLQTFWILLRANWGSFRFLSGALGIFPKSVFIAGQMQAENIKHVHAHFASHPAAAGFIIHRLVGIPYSFTAHGSDLHRDRHMLREKVSEAKFVVAISNYNRELIISECRGNFQDKVMIVHCGVNTEVFPYRFHKTPHEKGEQPFTILCVGSLHEVKGQEFLIRACHKLQERGIDFRCHFIGDGPDRESLAGIASETGISEKVYFHGQQKQAAIARLLQEADVLVAPSVPTRDGRREGIPVVLIEAMSSGVPVIASNLSGIPELVVDGYSGLLVPPRDSAALFDALEKYYHDPGLRERMRQSGRKKVVDEFDLFKNAASLVGLLHSEA